MERGEDPVLVSVKNWPRICYDQFDPGTAEIGKTPVESLSHKPWDRIVDKAGTSFPPHSQQIFQGVSRQECDLSTGWG